MAEAGPAILVVDRDPRRCLHGAARQLEPKAAYDVIRLTRLELGPTSSTGSDTFASSRSMDMSALRKRCDFVGAPCMIAVIA